MICFEKITNVFSIVDELFELNKKQTPENGYIAGSIF
ncbi:MAG: hypothetical protein RLZZ540_3098 [Bacteroidota bacterium]|jgi:hypothetical protein